MTLTYPLVARAQERRPLPYLVASPPPPSVQVRSGAYASCGKRTFDVLAASALALLAVPVLICVAIGVRVTLGHGVVFRQQRVGRDGTDFVMYKFRTMRHCRRVSQQPFNGPDRRQTHKHEADPRHTKLGRLLRKTSLDELPQLLNVLRGDMSLVGPRPELSCVVDRYDLRSHPRHQVRPGITGAWQTAARNDGALLHECFDHDLPYLTSVCLSEDLRILKRTASVLLAPCGR